MNHLYNALFNPARGWDSACLVLPERPTLTYGAVEEGSARYAKALRALAVKPGDRVAVQAEKSPEAVLLYLACIRSGAVFLPLNTAYTRHELSYFLGDAAPALFVARPENADELAAVAREAGVPAFETLGASGDGSLPERLPDSAKGWTDEACGSDDLAAILYTSGTTGRSKGAMLTHENLRSNASALVEIWRFSSDDVLIHALPIFHAHGLFVATNVSLMSGATMIFLPKFDPAEAIAWMPKATVMMGVPTFYTRLLARPELATSAARNMRLFVSGSAPLLAETHRAFAAATGQMILERYGMTETGMNTSNPYDGERVPGSVGLPLPGVSVRVCDPETGNPLATGETGGVELTGPNVFRGYWNMPDKTRSEFRSDGYFVTGDLGRIDGNGYLWILGRAKDLVITGGFNVYPKELEDEIDALEGVAESAVIGVPHPDFGEAVVAVVVRSGSPDISEQEIAAALKLRLAGFKLPKRILFKDELPRNAMAKVQKKRLREEVANLFAQ